MGIIIIPKDGYPVDLGQVVVFAPPTKEVAIERLENNGRIY